MSRARLVGLGAVVVLASLAPLAGASEPPCPGATGSSGLYLCLGEDGPYVQDDLTPALEQQAADAPETAGAAAEQGEGAAAECLDAADDVAQGLTNGGHYWQSHCAGATIG